MKVTPGPIEFPDDVGPGARLRRAREEADRSVSEISAALHLDSKTIQALEADSFDRLPGPTFVRGYMRSYACELGLTPEPILEAYERRGFKPPALSPGITEKPQTHASELSIRLVTYAVGAVLVLLVVLWWRSQDFQGLDIGADLLDWPLGSVSDPSPPPTETPALAVAPRNGEEGVESTPAAAGEPSEPPWDAGTAGDSRTNAHRAKPAAPPGRPRSESLPRDRRHDPGPPRASPRTSRLRGKTSTPPGPPRSAGFPRDRRYGPRPPPASPRTNRPSGEDLDTAGTATELGISARPALRPEATAGLATDEPPAGEDLDTAGTATELGISARPALRPEATAGLATDEPPAGEDLDTTGTAAERGISATPASRSGIDAETGSGDIGRPDLPVPNENASPDSPSAPEDAFASGRHPARPLRYGALAERPRAPRTTPLRRRLPLPARDSPTSCSISRMNHGWRSTITMAPACSSASYRPAASLTIASVRRRSTSCSDTPGTSG